MSLGTDIKEVIVEVGSAITLKRSSDVDGGYLDFTIPKQASRSFVQEFIIEAHLPYDTIAVEGDVVEFMDGSRYMIVHHKAEILEGAISEYVDVLYKCNVSGELFRPTGESEFDSNYRRRTTWTSVTSDCFALMTDRVAGTQLVSDEPIGQNQTGTMFLYVPNSVGIEVLDRYMSQSGEYYTVESVLPRQFGSIDMCLLQRDTRE